MKQYNNQMMHQKGFTLLEMLVGISIFLLTISIITTIFLSAIRAQRASIQMQNVIDNSRYAMETMSRAIRMSDLLKADGTSFSPPPYNYVQQNAAEETEIFLCHPTKGTSERFLVPDWVLCENQLFYDSSGGSIRQEDEFGLMDLTGENVNVSDLKFRIWGTVTGDDVQPRVTILMKVTQPIKFQKPEAREEIYLQTTITPRKLDI